MLRKIETAITIEHTLDLPPGGHVQSRDFKSLNGFPYVLSWYSQQADVPQSAWDMRTEVGRGFYRYSKGGGPQKHLGSFDDFDEAVAARIDAEKRYGFTGRQ